MMRSLSLEPDRPLSRQNRGSNIRCFTRRAQRRTPPRSRPALFRAESFFACGLLLAAGSRDFSGEIGLLLLDSLAESIAHKSGDLHRRTDLTLSFLHGLGNRFAAIVNKGLLQEANLLV